MAISKLILNGVTQIDLTQDTVASGNLVSPNTAHGADGEPVAGSLTVPTVQATRSVSYTPSETAQSETVTPSTGYDAMEEVSVSVGAISSAYVGSEVTRQAAQTLYPSTSDQTVASGRYLTGTQTFKAVAVSNTLTAANVKSGVVITIGDSADADRIMSITGTYSGGSSKNVQVVQSTSRTTSTTLTKVSGEITVSTTGTYDVYWSAVRTNTSSSYTWGSKLYIDSTGYETENTTWTNNVQSNHLTNVSLTANQKISVYARGRGGNYYACVPMLLIIQS